MRAIIDLVGKKFGRLTVIKRSDEKTHEAKWLCICDCGKYTTVRGSALRGGITKSCGCLSGFVAIKNHTTHGQSGTGAYSSWNSMLQRCSNPNEPGFENYGGRQIKVATRWKEFKNFFKDMGTRPPGHSIERLDSDGNYEPGNCIWADRVTQNNNTSRNRVITINGVSRTTAQWARELDINPSTIGTRLNLGWDEKKAILTPVRKRTW